MQEGIYEKRRIGMSNKEEWNRILQIVGTEEYAADTDFEKHCVKGFNTTRTLFYIVILFGAFYLIQEGRIIPKNQLVYLAILVAMPLSIFVYMKQKAKLHRELNRYAFRECYPDKGLSRYMSFVPTAIKKQMIWSITQYNFGYILFRLGKIDKATECLKLMQDSSETANNMLMAEHLKLLIALYYHDFDTVINCANEGAMLYSKASHTPWNNKINYDLQMYGAYAGSCKNNEYFQAYSVLATPQERPLDEVARQYYLYLAAKAQSDYENAEKFRRYVMENAGTTWYGNALREDFVPQRKPDNYPGYILNIEKLNNPSKVDRSRLKYALIGVLIVMLFYLVPRLF